MAGSFTIMGCGNSSGVPAVANRWGACDPTEPKNRRTRPAVCVQSEATTLVIDTGPDFVSQCNRHGIERLDGAIYTHAHGDHVNGIDDLRVWKIIQDMDIFPVYGNQKTLDELQARFYYMFECHHAMYPQSLEPIALDHELYGHSRIGDIDFQTFEQDHGTCISLGFRFGRIGYSTDMVDLDNRALQILDGIDIWIVDGAGYGKDETVVHANFERITELNKKINAGQVYLTHLTPGHNYRTLCAELPDGYAPAYDGLCFEF